MARDRYPKFRRAQRERGPYYRGSRTPAKKDTGFLPMVATASAAVFAVVLWSDKLPGFSTSAAQVSSDAGHEQAPAPRPTTAVHASGDVVRDQAPALRTRSAAQVSHDVVREEAPPPRLTTVVHVSRGVERDQAPWQRVYYSNCSEARAAGAAPIHAGEPGYRPEMDGDSDGIACEPYRGM